MRPANTLVFSPPFNSNTHPLTSPFLLPLLTTIITLTHTLSHNLSQQTLLHISKSHPSTPSTRHSTARTVSLYWTHALPQHIVITTILSLASLLSGIRAARMVGLHRRERTLVTLGTVSVAMSWAGWGWVGIWRGLLSGIARGYERAGIWKSRGEKDVEGGEVDVDVDVIKAEEEGRSREEIVDERVLQLLARWVRIGWFRSVSEGAAVLCFGWVARKG